MMVPQNECWQSIVRELQQLYVSNLHRFSELKLVFNLIELKQASGVSNEDIIRDTINRDQIVESSRSCLEWLQTVNAVSAEDSGVVDQKNRHGKFIQANDRRKILPAIMNLELVKSASASDGNINEWVHRRETLNETVEDQMMVLYKKDPRTAAMFSPEIAQILDCSEQAVRKSDNKVWQMFKAEKEAAKKKLRRRDTSDNLDEIDDE